jgi:hypothetical protein
MSDATSPPPQPAAPNPQAPPQAETAPVSSERADGAVREHVEGLKADTGGEESVDQRLAEIEMIGEESALGFTPAPHPPLSPEVRYLHVSRTINQLITDRNRSVGIFMGVASLLFAASTALLNARPDVVPIIPLRSIQYWCLPVTFGTLAVIGVFMCLILVRTRIGLIYEVSKMNALLGLPSERVKRVNPLSIFFLMYLLVATLGGACAGLLGGMLAVHDPAATHDVATTLRRMAEPGAPSTATALLTGFVSAFVYIAAFLAMYYSMILHATTESKLEKVRA